MRSSLCCLFVLAYQRPKKKPLAERIAEKSKAKQAEEEKKEEVSKSFFFYFIVFSINSVVTIHLSLRAL